MILLELEICAWDARLPTLNVLQVLGSHRRVVQRKQQVELVLFCCSVKRNAGR